MIIYGSKNKELAKEILTDQCQNCGKQNCVHIHVFQKYAHAFWIPIFPMEKTGGSQCDHCKQVLKLKEMPPSLRAAYDNLKSQTKTPIWTYSGLAIIAVLIAIGLIGDKTNDEKNAKLVLMPQSGDIFQIKTKDNQYTLYKVDEVQGDSVFVKANNYETNSASGLDDLKKKEYSEDILGFTKTELKQMLDKGEIIDIDRK